MTPQITIENQQREIEVLKDRIEKLKTALWNTATRYHEINAHHGAMDACQWKTCKDAAALLSERGGLHD